MLRETGRQREIDGVVPIIPMPFDTNEEIDETALRGLVDFAVICGVRAICLPAYGSEFYKLSDQERARVVEIAVNQAAGRLLVIAQSNHGSSRVALSIARANVAAGADLIALAVPRLFPLGEDDLLRYLAPVLNAVAVPSLVQDFNPGGPTISVNFVVRLLAECPNLRYLKLEEPLSAPKVAAIREATEDRVGILEGWGGLFMMELIPAGICGLMPGLGMADFLNQTFFLRKQGNSADAFDLYEKALPHITFSLQNMELYLYTEKRLLKARGLISNATSRNANFSPDPLTVRYVDELNERLIRAMKNAGLTTLVGRN
jgi:2-keto-3-deoxy-L-arabinonate dehydratase